MISELFISDQPADLYDDEPTLLNMSVADVRKPEEKCSTFSRTVKIPGTATNNRIFQHIFNITTENTFNPNTKSEALILQDGIGVFEGYLQLLRINVLDDNNIEYEVQLFAAGQNIFTDMGDNLMTGNVAIDGTADATKDINLSAYDHAWTSTNQAASWTAPVGSGYVYPLIDYGYTSNNAVYGVTQLFPAVYLKTLVDAIFAKYGYEYTSNFLNSEYFKRMVVPYSRSAVPGLSTSGILSREIMASQTSLNAPAAGTTFPNPFDDDSTPPNHDDGGNYNNATYIFTTPVGTNYIIAGIIKAYAKFTTTAAVTNVVVAATITVDVIKNGGINIYTNSIALNTGTISAGGAGVDFVVTGDLPFEFIGALAAGDTIKVNITTVYSTTNANITCIAGSDVDSYISVKLKEQSILYGDTFGGNFMLPIKVKQRDFLSSVLKLFNLYVDIDKDNSGKLLIEPRDDYYNLGSILNWDDKLDRSQQVVITPMSELDFKELQLRYADDGDYWNKLYKDEYNEPYGSQKVIMNTDFVKETKTIEVIFSPTPLVNQTSLFTPVVPAIYQMDNVGAKKLINTNPRLLYYSGLKSNIASGWNLTSSGVVSYPFTSYPYAGHLDDPYTATLDIDFGAPKKIYYFSMGDIQLTNNTLYGRFYRNYINEITNINSKLMLAWFKLNPMDILQLRMYDTIYVNGAYWRINKIIDYNATGNDLTQVELLFQIDSPAFAPSNTVINGGGGGDMIDGNQVAIYNYGDYQNTPTNTSQQRTIYGENFIAGDASGVMVSGEENVSGAQSQYITMLGCSNCFVGAGCYNITLLNCNGISVAGGLHDITMINCDTIEGGPVSGSVYINNILQ